MNEQAKEKPKIKWILTDIDRLCDQLNTVTKNIDRLQDPLISGLNISSDKDIKDLYNNLKQKQSELAQQYISTRESLRKEGKKLQPYMNKIEKLRGPMPFPDTQYHTVDWQRERLINLLCERQGYRTPIHFSHDDLICHPQGDPETIVQCCDPAIASGVEDRLFSSKGVFQVKTELDTARTDLEHCAIAPAIYWLFPSAPCNIIVNCQFTVHVWSDFTNAATGGKGQIGIALIHTDSEGNFPESVRIHYADVEMAWAPGEAVGFRIFELNETGWYDSGSLSYHIDFEVNQNVRGGIAMLCFHKVEGNDGTVRSFTSWEIGSGYGPYIQYAFSEA